MRRTLARITLTAAATAGLVATTYVQALGLGEINVSSALNQRLVASIPLTEISAEDLETVTVSLAPNEAYNRAGIERAEYLSTLNFDVKNDGGRPRVIVTSSQIAREPVLDLLVQARWSGGKIVRDYTILLDPPAFAVARPTPAVKPLLLPLVSAPVIAVAPVPAKPKPAPAQPNVPVSGEFYETPTETRPAKPPSAGVKVAPAVMDDATGSYGPVVAKQTLWNIATKVRPSAALSMDQVMLALAEANPIAIQRGTTVNKGAMLRVPSAERMQAASAAVAKARLQALRGGARAARAATPKAPARTTTAQQPSSALEAVKPVVAAPRTPAAEPTRPVLPKPQIALPSTATRPGETAAAAGVAQPKPPTPVIATPAQPAAAAPAPAPAISASAPAATPVDPAATATPVNPAVDTPAAVPAKSPLAQPPTDEPAPGFLADYGLPLVVAALVALLGATFLLFSRRRKKPAVKDYAQFKPGDTASVVTPSGGAGALGKLGDTTRLTGTQTLGSREMAAASYGMDGTQQMMQPVHAAPAATPAHQSTLILDAEAMATLNNAVKQSAVTARAEGFDRTTQIQVDTLHIDLGDNDPLSEADFHLAYGLYDEAILLLKTAAQQQPQRADLKMKLAETYFAAGRAMEFQETAQELKEKISPGEWSKLAIMGSQICPDVALFQSSDGDVGLDADFDLAFDEPSTPASATTAAGSIDFALSEPKPAASPAASTPMSRVLELSLDDDLDDDKPGTGIDALPPAGLDDEASIDFMLGQSLTPLGAGMKAPDSNELSFNLGSPSLNVPLPKVDITRGSAGGPADSMTAMSDRPTLIPGGTGYSLNLQDLEVSITPRQPTAESADDELNTKLDLARAYVEMGDNDMARSLLEEVQQQGGDRHQQEAASLLQRLPK